MAETAPPTYSEATTTTTSARGIETPRSTISSSSSVQGTPRTSNLSLPTTAVSTAPPWAGLEPPAGAQRAKAPLSVIRTDHRIEENFLVMLGAAKGEDREDVLLQTTNSRIECGIWVDESTEKGAVRMRAKTTNARIRLGVHTLAAHQAVDITVQTSNAQIDTFVPRDFHGLVILSTTNSSQSLSPSLQARSVRVPCAPDEKSKSAEYYEINGPNGTSKVRIISTNAKVRAGIVSDDVAAGSEQAGKGSDKCSMM